MSSQFYSILFHHILLYHFLFLFNIYYIESHLNSFLSDGRRAFASFLQSEYSQENIEFWVACEDFKQTSVDKMNLKAKMIFERYIDADSPSEVNLDSATREQARKNLERCDASCFEEAQSKIFTLMEKDSYRRFLKSKLFMDLSQPLTHNKPCSLEKKGKQHISDHSQCLPSYA
ncbi:regulator of G-protein signaling 4 isoform X2 [Pimephales promelas]|uniref:regulator of G-protein signaling 4 isoform X2 n=1 Tax=Pimephales promelas TaxID=90988 RepID=UPI001955CADD|nr:regulator of G-protein signaling 4 isoform X2 [Pimephales promelas]KAG1938567.1 regulator of G-protein signaling [Pimephales promelas]KAG1938568.1 regulator of G-protein signaling [Pimephales promelas]KAG1938570.1 regulator of G-protein signaling [Pimephales promelas]